MPHQFMHHFMQQSVPAAAGRPAVKQRPAIEELSRVALAVAVRTEDGELPAGATGTVVGVYRQGEAYEIEFTQPFHTVATVMPDAIRQ